MANPRRFFFAFLLVTLWAQTWSLPYFVKVLCEPAFLFIRYRAAALFNESGLGIGGLLTNIGTALNGLLKYIGHRLHDGLNGFAEIFTKKNQLQDNELESYKLLMYFKEEFIRKGFFSYARRRRRSLSEPQLLNGKQLARFGF